MASCPSTEIYSEFNYDKLREENIKKIKSYYDNILNDYRSTYQQYLEESNVEGDNSQDSSEFANAELRPRIKGLNEQLIMIKTKLKENNEQEQKNNMLQKKKIEAKTDAYQKNDRIINQLNKNLNQIESEIKGKDSQITDNDSRNTVSYYYHLAYIVGVLVIVGMFIHLLVQVYNLE